MNGKSWDAHVLIAGGGATGCMLALLLAQHGVRSLVAEARLEPYAAPRAHALNPRSLEICRSLGLDMARMHAMAAPREQAGRVRFVTRLFGPEFGSLPYERQDDGALEHTPTPLINLPQTEFEQLLFEAAASNPLIDFRRGLTWAKCEVSSDGVTSVLSGSDGDHAVTSRYLAGCDGAGSAVREAFGIGMTGDPAVVSCVSMIFRADLRQALAGREGMLFWVNDPATPGTFLAYHMDRLWTFVTMHPPGHIDMSRYDLATCRDLIITAAGGDIPDLEVLGVAPWTMTSQVADSFRDGPVFLVGDAAHRFPPTGGLGLNTGVQDAHNLAWKLAAALSGRAGDGLLNTYAAERRPVALRNAEQSYVNAKRLAALAALRCPQKVWSDPAAFERWLDEGERREEVAAAIRLQAEHFDSFGLQLGFVYGKPEEPANVGCYEPKAAVGSRLPHAWLSEPSGQSTLDLLDPTGFTLLASDERLGASAAIRQIRLSDPRLPADWIARLELRPGDGLLVRPDGHVAYRGPADGAAAAMETFLQTPPRPPA